MSFPRAQVKRFNEQPGCAPPPGHYTVPDVKKSGSGILSFETGGQRFKTENKSERDAIDDVTEQLSTALINHNTHSSSKKKLDFVVPAPVSTKSKSNSNKTTPHPSPSMNGKDKQRYEKEIRSLVQQISEQERKLQLKIQENVKLEGRINLLSKDKSSLLAHVATAEKKSADLERRNCVLQSQKSVENEKQNKRECLDEELKKTKQKLETAKKELDKCRSLLVALQSDLESSRSTISALKQSNNVLTQLNKEVQEHSDDVASQVSKLQGLADVLRMEKLTAEEHLAAANNKLQNVEKNFGQLLQEKVQEIEQHLNDKQQTILANLKKAEEIIEDLNKREEDSRSLITSLQNEKASMIQENDRHGAEISELEKKHKECEHTISNLRDEILTSRQNLTLNQEEASHLNEKICQLESDIQRLNNDHHEETEVLKANIKKCDLEYEQLTSLNEELQNNLKKFEQEKDDLHKQIEEKLKNEEENTQKVMEAEAKTEEAYQDLSKLKNKLKKITDGRSGEKSEMNKLFTRFKDLEKENEEMLKKYNHSQHETSELKEQMILLEAKADHLETHLMKANQNNSKFQENEELANKKIEQLEQTLKARESQYQAKLTEFTRRLLETQKKLNHKQEELHEIINTKESNITEMKQMRKLLEEKSLKLHDLNRLEKENHAMSDKINKLQIDLSFAQEEKSSTEDLEKWKKLYEDLREKVEPFQVQIDAYSAEKSMLLSENSAAHAEMQALGKKYAELLGHQNQKQKIRHVVKIKEENLGLKQEVAKLRMQMSKLQKQVLANRNPKFNPAEAFQHKKENATPFGPKN